MLLNTLGRDYDVILSPIAGNINCIAKADTFYHTYVFYYINRKILLIIQIYFTFIS